MHGVRCLLILLLSGAAAFAPQLLPTPSRTPHHRHHRAKVTMMAEAEQRARHTKRPITGYYEVATAVVRHPTTGEILCLKRSADVRSYPGYWHFISGGMEAVDRGDPLRRCIKELEEEVQLLPSQLEYVTTGRPLLVLDPRRRPLLVHPMLFELKEKVDRLDASVLNWENTDISWLDLKDIEAGRVASPTVPRLVETARRVLRQAERGGLPEGVQRALARIGADRDHGAQALMVWAVEALAEWAKESRASSEGSDVEDVRQELLDVAHALAKTRPAMAALGNGVTAVLERSQVLTRCSEVHKTSQDLLASVICAAESFLSSVKERNEAVTVVGRLTVTPLPDAGQAAVKEVLRRFAATGRMKVITISLSSTLISVFRRLADQGGSAFLEQAEIVVCESRPLLEGGKMAQMLSEMGYRVTVITDAQMSIHAKGADLCLLGADSITSEGDAMGQGPCAVNKAGSLPLTLACRYRSVPVLVVTSDLKVSYMPGLGVGGVEWEEKEPGEVLTGQLERLLSPEREGQSGRTRTGVRVRNVYFECVPISLVQAVVTESGALSHSSIVDRAAQNRARFELAFYH